MSSLCALIFKLMCPSLLPLTLNLDSYIVLITILMSMTTPVHMLFSTGWAKVSFSPLTLYFLRSFLLLTSVLTFQTLTLFSETFMKSRWQVLVKTSLRYSRPTTTPTVRTWENHTQELCTMKPLNMTTFNVAQIKAVKHLHMNCFLYSQGKTMSCKEHWPGAFQICIMVFSTLDVSFGYYRQSRQDRHLCSRPFLCWSDGKTALCSCEVQQVNILLHFVLPITLHHCLPSSLMQRSFSPFTHVR